MKHLTCRFLTVTTTFMIALASASTATANTDVFRGFNADSSFEIKLSPLPFQEEYSGFDSKGVFTRNGKTLEVPCSVNGSFLKKPDGTYNGHRQYFCQIYKRDAAGEVDSITFWIQNKWTKKNDQANRRGSYIAHFSFRSDSKENPLKEETEILLGQNLTETLSFKTSVENSLSRNGYFALVRKIENILLKKVGIQLYAGEVERPVWTWGYNYHIGHNGDFSLGGRFGKTGADFSLYSDEDIPFVDDRKADKPKISKTEVLEARIDAFLKENSED